MTISELNDDKSSHYEYSSSKFNIKKKIENDKNFHDEDLQDINEIKAIDMIYEKTIAQYSDNLSWRSYNSDLDGLNRPVYCGVGSDTCCCCFLQCCSDNGRNRIQYFTWPIWWCFYHLSCCCMCNKKDYIYHHSERKKTKIGAKIYDAKKKLKHMKRHKFNDNLRTIYAMIQLTK